MSLTNLITECDDIVENFYNNGKGLRSTLLKNYTSGDGINTGMESVVENILWKAVDEAGIDRERVKINQDYFKGDSELDDPQRMDFHVWVDDLVVLVIESRAWIDKPFYTLKRAVVRNFMELPYVQRHLADDVQFAFVALAADYKDRLEHTLNKTMGYEDRVQTFKFSPYRRGHKGGNYFDFGFHKPGVKSLSAFLYDHLSRYK
tara:strand:- start:1335 stop:1946 length:612 start_codon:yes stop_codon:yes gene_type:complete